VAKGYCVTIKVRDRKPVIDILVNTDGRH